MTAMALPRITLTRRPAMLAGVLLIVAGSLLVGQGLFIRAKALLAQVLLERAWSQTVAAGRPVRAWSWADTYPVAKITFPGLDRAAIVLEAAGGEALAFGPAHVAGSPLPGERGTSVIGGHRDTHFAFIGELKKGDSIIVTGRDGRDTAYNVSGSVVVHAGASGIRTGGNTRRLALVTCYPFGGLQRGPLRYVVFAEAAVP